MRRGETMPVVPMAISLFPPRSPSGSERANLSAYWALILPGSLAVPGFWFVDRANGMVYDDPLAYRLALGVAGLAALLATYASPVARRHVRSLAAVPVYASSAFMMVTAIRNGRPPTSPTWSP